MATGQPFKVAVVGGGIMGIGCGIRILETFPGADVTIFTDRLSPNTTSDVAAGFWTPVYMGNTPSHLINLWSGDTYRFLQSLIKTELTPIEHGVHYCPGYRLYRSEQPPEISWSGIPVGFRPITKAELSLFPAHIKSGYFFVSIMAEGRKLTPYMMNRFLKRGGRFVSNTHLTSFDDLVKRGYNRIVNCSGLGARELCGDAKMHPVRGQLHRVRAPWMNFWLMEPETSTYVLPNSDTVVLGGTAQAGNWSMQVSETDREDILRRVTELWPPLASAQVVQDCVGLRPGREAARVEREKRGDLTIYHNYGHGGSGITTFWGCAGNVLKLMLEDTPNRAAAL